jgi:hypothetical protein
MQEHGATSIMTKRTKEKLTAIAIIAGIIIGPTYTGLNGG